MHYIIIGPSGSGKDTLIKDLLNKYSENFQKLVSNATREKRNGEIEGYNYYYIDKMPENYNDYFNYVIYNGNFYGYTHQEMENKIKNSNKSALIIVEPSGMQPFIDYFNENKIGYKTIFIDIDKDTIIKRLLKRGDDLEKNRDRIEKDVEYFSDIKKKTDIVLNGMKSSEDVTKEFLFHHNKLK